MKIWRNTLLLTILITPLTSTATETRITVGFSPGNSATMNVLNVANSAHRSLDVAAYGFTSRQVAEALLAAQRRGVKVRVLADAKDNGGKYSAVTWLQRQGVPVRLNGKYAIQHNKFMVADGVTTQTGSYNYTSSASRRNAENTLVVWDHQATAAAYQLEFDRLWGESFEPENPMK
ncbi:UNVERIFIED_ORG: phosphatidylserine/phosphatidylglycerophosphate/cardiolipin synthase-like enzyme [Buttiauxella agrestis ATCC 33320]